MTQREAAIQQLKALKEKPLKEKLKHIFTYYKLPIVAILLAIILVISGVCHLASAQKTVLHISCLDAVVRQEAGEAFQLALSQALGIDRNKELVEISVNRNQQDEIYAGEALAAQIMGGMIDVLALPEETSLQWLYQDVFANLSELLTAEQMQTYKGSFLYVDGAVLEQMDHLRQEQTPLEFPDPTKPEEMEDPIPVAMRVPTGAEFAEAYFSNHKSVVIGIVANAPNLNNAVFFLNYMMEIASETQVKERG